jgi:hypothetical protein
MLPTKESKKLKPSSFSSPLPIMAVFQNLNRHDKLIASGESQIPAQRTCKPILETSCRLTRSWDAVILFL